MALCAAFAPWVAPYDPLTVDYARACWRRRRRSTGSAPIRSGATCSRASSTARAPRSRSASSLPSSAHARRDHRRGVGVLRRQDRPHHPGLHGRPAVLPDHRAGDHGGGGARQQRGARHRHQPDHRDRAAMLPRVERVVRASALAIREMPYMDAARAAGYLAHPHHLPPHRAQRGRALPHHADRVRRRRRSWRRPRCRSWGWA